MTMTAFGVDDTRISKAATLTPLNGTIPPKQTHKLRDTAIAAGAIGAGIGGAKLLRGGSKLAMPALSNPRFVPSQRMLPLAIGKSAFDVEDGREEVAKKKGDKKKTKYGLAALGGNSAGGIVGAGLGALHSDAAMAGGGRVGGLAGLVGGVAAYSAHRKKQGMDV